MNTSKMIERIIGVVTLKPAVYKSIAEDPAATTEAWIIFAVVTVITAFIGGIGTNVIWPVIVGLVIGAIALYFTAFVLAKVAVALGGKTDTAEMLRISGYVSVFGIVGVLNIVVLISPALLCVTSIISLAVVVLRIIGFVIGVREAAEFSTTNAIITAIVAAVVNFIIVTLIGGAIIGALVVAASAVH
jgi:hypothetical protein